jgi:NADH-quinone oxidoreductase subunit H
MTAFFQSLGLSYEWAWTVATVAAIIIVALLVMFSVAMVIYVDRKVLGAIMLRRGPNVVGPFGLLQSFADGLKVFLQETIIPTAANKGIFLLAPIITFTVALAAWAVIPFWDGGVIADINVGLLYILAISSMGVYGVVMSGWASNSKYPFFSAMRASAQMISYEVSIGFVLVCVVLFAGTFNLSGIVSAQQGFGLGVINAYVVHPLLFPMWVVFFISSLAETARAPFDLTEAESELVAGYQTEYSSMSFALFWLGEYANILLMCSLNTLLFWGGWLPPLDWAPLYYVPGIVWFLLKTFAFFLMFSWIWATVPRYRYDQLMRLGWKVFLPMSLLFVVLTSGWLMATKYGPEFQAREDSVWRYGGVEGETVRRTFSCDSSHSKADYRADLAILEDVRLTIERQVGSEEAKLEILHPKSMAGVGTSRPYDTGSFGGSEAYEWTSHQGAVHMAFVSYTDIITENWPSTIWVQIGARFDPNDLGMVCGLVELENLGKVP